MTIRITKLATMIEEFARGAVSRSHDVAMQAVGIGFMDIATALAIAVSKLVK